MENKINDVEAVRVLNEKYTQLLDEIKKVIYGQDQVIEEVLISIFSRGHCLLVGVPGLAKTLLVTTIANALGLKNKRIQFTPDLMPSDIIGTEILDEKRQFRFIKGPLFANFILADEINRTPPKTQAALLEAMQERTITAAGTNYKLEEPFFVMATQNPIEQEGTYPLPEAQLDRFMFNIYVDYPSFEDEITIVKNTTADLDFDVQNVMTAEEIVGFQKLIRKIPVNDQVLNYAVGLVAKTRPGTKYQHELTEKYIQWGAGPRASQYLIIGAKTHAVLHGKYSPDIEDVKAVAKIILRHRLMKNYKAEAESLTIEDIIDVYLKD
ncbi:MAG: MoxR family ATPase [Bacteroidales bacterium]|jgi:MoxR-like ATPase|nr:MoxR family ATPase [Bacteroidales bacterium]